MYSGAGKDACRPRRNFGRNFTVRNADLRSILVVLVPGRAGQLRNGFGKRIQCRRLQAPDAGHFVLQRHVPQFHASSRLRLALTRAPRLLIHDLEVKGAIVALQVPPIGSAAWTNPFHPYNPGNSRQTHIPPAGVPLQSLRSDYESSLYRSRSTASLVFLRLCAVLSLVAESELFHCRRLWTLLLSSGAGNRLATPVLPPSSDINRTIRGRRITPFSAQ